MSEKKSEKKRSENYSFEDRRGVIEGVKKRKNITEDKRNDTNSNQKKQTAWTAIKEEMARSFPDTPERSMKDVKELWRQMKNKAKAAAREKKVDIVQTGGGKAVVGDLSEEQLAVLDIIVDELEQYINKYDDDSQLQGEKDLESTQCTPGPSSQEEVNTLSNRYVKDLKLCISITKYISLKCRY